MARHLRKDRRGFTLVELMVVVTILGLLAAIAVTSYGRIQNRVRQGEAKVALASIYTALRSFHASNGSYTGCLVNAGFGPTTNAQRFYSVGFGPGTAAMVLFCGPAGNARCDLYDWTVGAERSCTDLNGNPSLSGEGTEFFSANAAIGGTSAQALDLVGTTTLAPGGFRAGAAGRLSSGMLDVWTIDETKRLNQEQVGI